MLFPKTNRETSGVYIEGEQIGLRLVALAEGTISVSIIGMPNLTGFDAPCRLAGDDLPEFAPAEIAVHDKSLSCYAVDKHAPALRTGFTLELEPGMATQLREWLPQLAIVVEESKAIAALFNAQLPPPAYHMFGAITSVVARIALTGWTIEQSIAYERKHGTWRKHMAFMAQFDTAQVIQRLQTLAQATAAHSGTTTL